MNACLNCAVRERAICQSLPVEDLTELHRAGRRQSIKRGQTLWWQGGDAHSVAHVTGGVLKLCVAAPEGREQTVGIKLASDFIGRPFGETNSHSVVALTDADICSFPRHTFDAFVREHQELERELLLYTLNDLDRTRHWILLFGHRGASERIAIFLLHMAERCAARRSGKGTEFFDLPMGRRDIADLLVLTIETVSRQFTVLRSEGIIATSGQRSVRLLDRERLKLRISR